jgi:hypothetical protein
LIIPASEVEVKDYEFIIVTGHPDPDKLFIEIKYKGEFIAELNNDNDYTQIVFSDNIANLKLNLEELLEVIDRAKKRLNN